MSANRCVLEGCRANTAHPDHLLCPEHALRYYPRAVTCQPPLQFVEGFLLGIAAALAAVLCVLVLLP